MEAPSVFPEELLNICPVVYQALHTPAALFQAGNGTPAEHNSASSGCTGILMVREAS